MDPGTIDLMYLRLVTIGLLWVTAVLTILGLWYLSSRKGEEGKRNIYILASGMLIAVFVVIWGVFITLTVM
jgi:heme/copper-type cytochrome/quinol oxidase subunit 2